MWLSVTHLGVPLGSVDLEVGTRQGIGTLAPLAAFEAIAPVLRAAGGVGAAARVLLLTLPPDVELPPSPALRAAAALTFELWDAQGIYVHATTVRLVELVSRHGVTVFVDFGDAGADVAARTPHHPRAFGAESVPLDA